MIKHLSISQFFMLAFLLAFSLTAEAGLTFKIAPYGPPVEDHATLGLSAGIDTIRNNRLLFNIADFGVYGPWDGTSNAGGVALSSALLFRAADEIYVGARAGMFLRKRGTTGTKAWGFGALAARYAQEDSSLIYEVDLGQLGAGQSYAQLAFGWKFF